MQPKIIVTRRWPRAVEQALEERYDVTFNKSDRPLSPDDLREAIASADAVLPTVTDRLDASVFERGRVRTKILGNYGVGFSHIDVDTAKDLGITVTNTPDVLSECTADIAITLMLMAARRAGEGERELRAGEWTGWRPTHLIGQKLSGKTLGIIGFGRIGREVARRARFGFGMQVIAQNRSPIAGDVLAESGARQVETVDELLAQSDFVSLHCPGGDENRHLIDARRLAVMKPTAILVNTARGEVVDEDALVDALKARRIAGAGLDVFEGEPAVKPGLLACENAVLLPHLGSATMETREAMGFRVLQNLDDFFEGRTPRDKVA
jgi:glyoxylate reductase